MRAHFNRPVLDAAGNVVTGGEVMVYNLPGGGYYTGDLYTTADGVGTYTMPWVATDGIIDFWTDHPVAVSIGYRPSGQDETLFVGASVINPDFYRLSLSYRQEGPVAIVDDPVRYYVEEDMFIEWVRASVGVPPTGSSIQMDVTVDGTDSLWVLPTSAPEILADEDNALAAPDAPFVGAGSYLNFHVTQNGSSSTGEYLHIQVLMRRQGA